MRKVLLAIGCLFCTAAIPALAQTSKAPWEEYDKLIRSSETLGALGPTLFGDAVDLASGGLSFSSADVSIPGNNGLTVAFSRKFTVSNRRGYTKHDSALADWELDTPRIEGVFAPNWQDNRCSAASTGSAAPPTVLVGEKYFYAEDYWHGNQANMPGGGAMLYASASAPKPTSGGPYHWMTSNHTYFSCLSGIKNGSGEGFLAIAADGTKYWFDWMAQYAEPQLQGKTQIGQVRFLSRKRNVLYATRVEDRFGNWVTYSYVNASTSPALLTEIASSDGRRLAIGHNPQGQVASVNDGARTWTYEYSYPSGTTGSLTGVVLPDGSRWTIGFAGLADAGIMYQRSAEPGDVWRDCFNPGDVISPGAVGTITHPSGAVGEFSVAPIRHGRTNVPAICLNYSTTNNDANDDTAYYAINWDSLTLTQKKISGPGLATAVWQYAYTGEGSWFYHPSGGGHPVCGNGANCTPPQCTSDACAGSSTTTVTGPSGQWTRHTFGTSYRYNEGKLLKMESGNGPTAILRTETTAYQLAQSGQPYLTPIGTSPQRRGDGFVSEYVRPARSGTVTQDGASFSWTVNQCGSTDCFDAFARPLNVTKSSSLGYSKTNTTEYFDDLSRWVLGQVKRTTTAGIETSRTEFDGSSLPWQSYAFGKLQQTLTYNSDGTVATVKDGRNNTVTLSGWKRGIPQTVQYPATPEAPAGSSESAIVNDNGWITAVTDENGYATGYGYDAMGRLASVVYPTGDSVGWANTTRSFQQVWINEYGIPAGHWKQTTSTGNGTKVSYFDAMWRPLVEESYDAGDAGNTRSLSVKRYDPNGQLAFQSYPIGSLTDYATISQGIRTTYDPLGRVTKTEQDSEWGPLPTTTEYLSGLQTKVTNPRGHATITAYQAYNEPSLDMPVVISHPEGAYTDIYRDALGKTTALRRRNADASQSVWRRYVYDSYQQLCKTIEPETGATVMDYDGTGNLAWSAAGLALPDLANCNRTEAYSSGRRVDRSYDARNRVATLLFPDGRGNQSWSYEKDGAVAGITTNNSNGGEQVINRYTYNKRRLLTGESVEQPGWDTWSGGHGYNANGHLAVQTFPPTGLTIDYAPNALGQATRAGTYATGVGYYPNGAVKQFMYGNGIVHTMTQNARQLPATTADGLAQTYRYGYDANGNVDHVQDTTQGNGYSIYSRWMTYDGLDRLTGTGAGMFGGTDNWHRFTYDTLDNLKTWKLAGVKDHNYYYDPNENRLTNINTSTGVGIVGLGYDMQGNLQQRNGQGYQFDYGNRLREVTGKEYYRYDGHGRRVLAWTPTAGSILSQYSQTGQLVFQQDGRQQKNIDHIYLAGSLVATREYNWGTGATSVRYQHTDALGSPVAVTNESGQVVDRTQFEPFGAAINKTIQGVGYTGHVMDAVTGLTYMQQRYYDPTIGRFLSVDPVAANSNTGAGFNRYWYAANNPYKFTDPDGRCEKVTGSNICGGGGFAGSVVTGTRSVGPIGDVRASGGMKAGPSAFTTRNAQERFNKASKEVNAAKEGMEGRDYKTQVGAARSFYRTMQPISSKYGVEISSLIDQRLSGAYFLSGTEVGMDFRPDGIGYTVGGPSDGLPTIHSHPLTGGLRGHYYPFSDSDVSWNGAGRSSIHFVTTPDGIFRFNGVGQRVTEVAP